MASKRELNAKRLIALKQNIVNDLLSKTPLSKLDMQLKYEASMELIFKSTGSERHFYKAEWIANRVLSSATRKTPAYMDDNKDRVVPNELLRKAW
tara:strand:- start:65 stop:349 length:285 start_codon:yes stop_codon:yes gene_type:complete